MLNPNLVIPAKTTKAQLATCEDLDNSSVQGNVRNLSFPEYANNGRLQVFIETKCGFQYSLYVGKRGKIYEYLDGPI